MKATELISALNVALAEIKSRGQMSIPVEGLENYLANAESIANDNQEKQTENIRLDEARTQFQYDFEVWKVTAPLQNSHQLEMFKSVVDTGQTAIKSAILINGGAAVALLAFLGNLLTKDAPQGVVFPIDDISFAMLIFVIGVGCAGGASALGYLTQRAYHAEMPKIGGALNVVALLAGLSSIAAFFWGGVEAYLALL
jgi:hypothetical protein